MIEFRGVLSETTKKFILKCNTFGNACICITISLLCSAVTIAIAMYYNIYILIFLAFFVMLAIFGCIPFKKALFQQVPTAVIIEDDNIYLENKSSGFSRKIEQVKKVIDTGDWYHIVFYFPHKNILFLCQKDLLVNGSFEDFEKLFEGKIVRKKDN